MKIYLTSLILLTIVSLNAIAQDSTRWGLPEGAKARLDIGGGAIFDVTYSPDGTRLAVASGSGVWLYDVETGAVVPLMRNGNSSSAFGVAFSPDGRTVAIAADEIISIWDAVTRVKKRSLSPKFSWASHVVFRPDGRTIAGGGGEIVRLWDVVTGKRKRTMRNEPLADVTSIAFNPDGRTLASGHRSPLVTHRVSEGEVHLWDAETGKRKDSINASVKKPTSLAYSPDGRTLAIGHFDAAPGVGSWGWVSLWDAETLEFKRQLGVRPDGFRLDDGVGSVAFSPDGRTLAVGRMIYDWGGNDAGIVRFWDVATGEHLRTLDGHTDDVNSVAFSPDGRTLASGSLDGTVLLWEITPPTDVSDDAEPRQVKPDVNEDGVVDIRDLALVAGRLGKTAENRADVNGDSVVNILDLALVAGMMDNVTVALPTTSDTTVMLRAIDVKQWLEEARRLDLAHSAKPRAIEYLQNLLEALTPKQTALLPNYPNPFNPETWIPYQLAREAGVQISIYNSKGVLVRQLDLGLQPEGFYTDRHHAAYWDGRNESGELLASGLYVYVFRAGSYRALRRMAIVR